MSRSFDRSARTGGGAAFGAGLAAVKGATPIGIAVVAGLGGALAYKSRARRR
jgi:hypothetical protein